MVILHFASQFTATFGLPNCEVCMETVTSNTRTLMNRRYDMET